MFPRRPDRPGQRCWSGPRAGRVRPDARKRAPTREAIIATGLKPASWAFAEEFVAEDEVLANARGRAKEVGVVPIGSGGGAALRFLAAVTEARAVVEIGTGTGVSGVWMLRGMRPDGVLTTVDTEAEHQRLAKEAFTEAGIPSQRVRLIPGAALEVLPRLTDGHYDLVFADGDKLEYSSYLDEALRLLRPAGSWPSTTRCGTTGWPTPPSATRRRCRSASCAAPWPTTTCCCRCCSPSATACSSPRRCGPPSPDRPPTGR